MKIVCLSDTHGLHNHTAVPNGDMLIHAGDITSTGALEDIIRFNSWLGTLSHKYKIVVAGNHDLYLERDPHKAKELLTNAIYLNDCGVDIDGVKIWGSPVSPAFHDWAFNRKRGAEIGQHWALIPTDTDILITHCPPHGILDKTNSGKNEGCVGLRKAVQNTIKPRLHIFGHIHEAYGQVQILDTLYVNASLVGPKNWIGNYKPIRHLRRATMAASRLVSLFRKNWLGVSKEKPHNKSLSHLQWKIVNRPVIIEL